ncbi:NADH-quinone oxidoreductase subunit C [Candidatus Poriferisocius sp.]|uniref:NADH-quinone oxidoreductase subunit C n=1 Tax=Candidatus Poriferisocius sp. TaxID=3101276 RepID=UPI003B5A3D10
MSSTEADTTEAGPPPDEHREAWAARLADALGDGYLEHHIIGGQDLWVRVSRESWVDAATAARDQLGCAFFDWLSAIDWLPSPYGRDMNAQEDDPEPRAAEPVEQGHAGGETRFQMVMRLHSITEHRGLTIKADLPDDDLSIDTLIPVFAGANWHEREAWEMFGILFHGHPDLRHLYLPGEFEGNPLRKDYPLLARRVKPWPGIVDVELFPGEDNE